MSDWNEYEDKTESAQTDKDGKKSEFYGTNFEEYETPPKGENRYAYESVILDPNKSKTKAYSIVALVGGILSLTLCCGAFGLIPAVVAVIFAIVAKKHLGYMDGMAMAGLITGIIGLVIGAATLILSFTILQSEDFWGMIEEILKEAEEAGPYENYDPSAF